MRDRKRRNGLSLAELLVVMALTVGLVTIISMLFLRSRDAVRLSTERLDTSGRSRRTMDALTPFVASAIDADGKAPLEASDSTPTVLDDPCWLRVTTREDLLDVDYQPGRPYAHNALVLAHRFQISFRPATRELVAEQLRLTSTGEEVDPDVKPTLLGRDVDGCGFRLASPGSVEVTLRARSERDDERRPGGVTTSTLRALLAAPGVIR
jgi:hypothetical protein